MELIYFSSKSCTSCGMVGKYVDELEDIKVTKIDAVEQRDLAISNGVLSVPTIILKSNNAELKRHTGFINKTDLNDFIYL